ncbi:MAG: hypothetical protein CSB33_02980 [Desulfobacterales bacterium]|nr:MAG: hypothetical protein CSB33_02980 [Desulfobacterales bacterium]
MARRILGLDIRSDGVAAVLLSSGLRDREVDAWAFLPIADEPDPGSARLKSAESDASASEAGVDNAAASSESVITEPDKGEPEDGKLAAKTDLNEVPGQTEDSPSGPWRRLRRPLMDAARHFSPEDTACAVSFPAMNVSFRNLRLPFSTPSKIIRILPFELEPLLPAPVDSMMVDFQTLGLPSPDGGAEILAAAVDRELLADFIGLLTNTGLEPHTIRVSGYATAMSLNLVHDTTGNTVLVEIRKNQITAYILAGGKVGMARSMRHPGSTVQAVTRMLTQTLTAFEENLIPDAGIENIFLSGPLSACLKDEDIAHLEQRIGLPFRRLDLRREVRAGLTPIKDEDWSPGQMDGALALALMEMDGRPGLNFRKGDFARKTAWSAQKPLFLRLGVYALLIALFFGADALIRHRMAAGKIAELKGRTEAVFRSLFPDTRIKAPLHQMKTALDELRSEPAGADFSGGNRMIDLLDMVSRSVPVDLEVDITRMLINEKQVLITGETDTMTSVDRLQGELSGIPLFGQVEIVTAKTDPKTQKADFKLKADLKRAAGGDPS